MPKSTPTVLALWIGVLAAACGASGRSTAQAPPPAPLLLAFSPQGECTPEDAAAFYPGEQWSEIAPASAGWFDDGVRHWLDAAQRGNWAAGMIIHRGRVVAQFGDLDRPYDARSIRKSVMGAVIGQLVAEGRLSLDSTLADLGIDDEPPLTGRERAATLRHLLQSRSGVYREGAFMTAADREDMPAPGAHAPGEAYWYNNWGFNALGTIVRNVAGPLDQVVETRVAEPLGMQDFAASDVRERFEDVSQHSAYRIWMSTRDRARFGYLYLRHGCWNGRQIVPVQWVAESLYPHTNRDDADDFGYVWRSQEAIERIGMTERWYSSRGNNLQYIMLVPEWDVVVVLTTDMDRAGWMNMAQRRIGMMPEMSDVSAVLTALGEARPR
jgi:CubicO group peptidase (beta-lactamase class C family)